MSDKVGSSESRPKLHEVLMHHQNAAEQVMHDKNIIEALKPNLLGLINNGTMGDNSLYPYMSATQNQINQQQLATTAALDIFAYCQYISSMMLFKAMSQNENSPLPNGGEKSPSTPTSPLFTDIPQDYSMKNTAKSTDQISALSFDTLPPSNGIRTENKKSSSETKSTSKSESRQQPSNTSNRKFVSSERRPRQAYNTKQLEKLESEFQVNLISEGCAKFDHCLFGLIAEWQIPHSE